MTKYTIKKFNGDSSYDWAVFRKEEVKGIKGCGPVFLGEARPIVSGLTRRTASYYKNKYEGKYNGKEILSTQSNSA